MRTPQPEGRHGSLRWIQRATQEPWPSLNHPILSAIPSAKTIVWLSPLKSDAFAEYRDDAFLTLLGLSHLIEPLQAFWPKRGPQWDALGKTDNGQVLMVEAKAHIPEMCSPGTSAGEASRVRIVAALDKVALDLGARPDRAAWTEHFYQLGNRIAHLHFLREQGVQAWLVLVNFLGDPEMGGPTTPEAWEAAYQVAFYVMGLPKTHKLSRYIIDVYPDVSAHFVRASEERDDIERLHRSGWPAPASSKK